MHPSTKVKGTIGSVMLMSCVNVLAILIANMLQYEVKILGDFD